MVVMVSFIIVMLVLVDRIERDRLEHPVMLLARRMAKRRPGYVGEWQLGVRNAIEQIPQQCQSAKWLVVEVHERPWRKVGIGRRQHELARLGVILVMFARLEVDRGELPALHRVVESVLESLLLHFLV